MLSGMMKLRLSVTFLFLLMFGYFYLVFSAADVDLQAEYEFYDSLSENEIDTLINIYENYPETNTDSSYELAGYLQWFVIGGLFILMIKVWRTKEISNKDFYIEDYIEKPYDVLDHLYDEKKENKFEIVKNRNKEE